jgi:hypothetical protein
MTTSATSENQHKKPGRPFGSLGMRQRLRAEFINAIGEVNLTPSRLEAVRSAVEWSAIAAEARAKLAKSADPSPDDAFHVAKIEEIAIKAVSRLNLPAPTAINTRAV